MEDQIISYETAKLAKEKGFISIKPNCYGDNLAYSNDNELKPACRSNVVEGYILAPTQSLLQKFIREKRGVHIEIRRNASGYYWDMCKADGGTNLGYSDFTGINEGGVWDSFEEALENALYVQLSYDLPKDLKEKSKTIKHWANYAGYAINASKS